ncbi:hypothetical protein NS228_25720 [Methylobacterium indicum]|nr:hypothetical protein NS228_25720 [Methylobacterium indicum]KTS35612.1 hypothetical protein NS229_09935 [Methylobacterium indicum]
MPLPPPPEPTPISEGCPLVPGSLTFSDTIETCLESFGCDAGIRLCTGAAAVAGRTVAGTVVCPRQLGAHFALYERSLIADRLRQRRCYPQSYSWLAGLTGPEAANARGAWRAKVCPEAPAVFSDPLFAQLGPITDGPCTR